MKDIFSSFFRFQKDRIQNPFFLAFTTSWIILNWKMIAFLLFSDKIIEDKVLYIQDNFEIAANMVWWPILSAAAYTFGLQYFNALIEYVTAFAIKKRVVIHHKRELSEIENKRELAIENIKTEDAQIEYREKRNVNQKIEEIEAKYNSVLLQLDKERHDNSKIVSEQRVSLQKLELESEARLKRAQVDNVTIKKELDTQQEKNKQLIEEIEILKSKLSHKNTVTLYDFSGGPVILESLLNGTLYYHDITNKRSINDFQFKEFQKRYRFQATVIY